MEKLRWDFRNLDIWKKARELRLDVESLVKTFPKEETFRLVDQMVRAIRSVTANIAEGHGRFHYQENIQFLRQSRGSLQELIDDLNICSDESYMEQNVVGELKKEAYGLVKKLNGYIKYLKSCKEGRIS